MRALLPSLAALPLAALAPPQQAYVCAVGRIWTPQGRLSARYEPWRPQGHAWIWWHRRDRRFDMRSSWFAAGRIGPPLDATQLIIGYSRPSRIDLRGRQARIEVWHYGISRSRSVLSTTPFERSRDIRVAPSWGWLREMSGRGGNYRFLIVDQDSRRLVEEWLDTRMVLRAQAAIATQTRALEAALRDPQRYCRPA